MACDLNFSITSISDWLVYPVGCDFYFYLKILIAIFGVIAWTLYKSEKKVVQKSELLSSLGVSSIGILILSLIGTLIKNTADIPMISVEVMLIMLSFTIPIILVWIFKK